MSRSGYSDDYDGWSLIMYRGAVASAVRGRRGQAFLRELLATLDAMENKRLIANELSAHGEVCAIGSVGIARGIDMSELDPKDAKGVAKTFGIAPALAREIVFMNDEYTAWGYECEDPEARFSRMRKWIASLINDVEPK